MDDIVFHGDPQTLTLQVSAAGDLVEAEQFERILIALNTERVQAALLASIEEANHV